MKGEGGGGRAKVEGGGRVGPRRASESVGGGGWGGGQGNKTNIADLAF